MTNRCPTCHRKYTATSFVYAALLEHGPCTAFDLEGITGFTAQRCRVELCALQRDGLVDVTGTVRYRRGRKPINLYKLRESSVSRGTVVAS